MMTPTMFSSLMMMMMQNVFSSLQPMLSNGMISDRIKPLVVLLLMHVFPPGGVWRRVQVKVPSSISKKKKTVLANASYVAMPSTMYNKKP
jgi:hypothetical protein